MAARHGDISSTLAFSGGTLARLSEQRPDGLIEACLAEEQTRILAFAGGRLVHDATPDALHTPARFGAAVETLLFLGRTEAGAARLAADLSIPADQLANGLVATDLRTLMVQGLFGAATTGDIAHGAALLSWHRTNRFCGRCGGATLLAAAGAKRICEGCAAEHFPRTDPVAIMLAVRDGRCIVGRGRHFPPGMYSCLAGFIEPGETIENAVRRETLEESGIRIGAVRYVASQPWPMPHSLMIGCIGEALDDEIAFDADELEDCRWVTRDECAAMAAGNHREGITLPVPGTIAGTLLRLWIAGAV